jgi:hypothetical protein
VLLQQSKSRNRPGGAADSEEIVLADRLYFHLLEQRGLVIEADAYVANADERSSYQLGEAELLAEAQKALDELSA